MGAVGGVAILGGNFEAATFPEDKVVQRSLTVGNQEVSDIDAVILDALPLGAPGQLDSHAMLWKGHSNDGSPHTIDWKAFVNVTADDGTGSLWTLQTRIDGAPYTDILTVDDNGLLTVSGATFTMDQLIIDSDNTEAVLIRKDGDAGDVFIVDTVNDVVRMGSNDTFLTFGASSDARLERFGPRDLGMREPGVGGVSLGAGGENTFRIYARDDVAGSAARFLELTGDGPLCLVKANRFAGGGQFDLNLDVSVGRLAFFNEGVQRWNIQGSVTADFEFAPFITNRYDIGSAALVVRNVYTHGVIFGTTPSSTGTIRLQNADDIVWRNAADDDDIPVFSFASSDIFDFGDPGAPTALAQIRIRSPEVTIPAGRLEVVGTNASALRIADGSSVLIFNVDTTNRLIRLAQNDSVLTFGTASDVQLHRDFADVLALRRGTNDQFFYVYGTFTDSSNYERLALYAGTSVNHFLESQSAGTGNDDINLTVRQLGDGNLDLGRGSTVLRLFGGVGLCQFTSNNTVSFGQENAGQPAQIWVGTAFFVGNQDATANVAITLDSPTMVGVGTRDSHAILWTGQGFDSGAHDVDWKAFVDVTANDGTGSIFTLQTRIDAAGFATVFQIDDAGNLTIPGSFIVDGLIIDVDSTEAFLVRKNGDGGDVFTVDTVNEVVMLSSAASLNWSTDLKLFRDAAWVLALRDGTNANELRIYQTFTDAANFERLSFYGGGGGAEFVIETQTAGTGTDSIDLILDATGPAAALRFRLDAQSIEFSPGIFNFTGTVSSAGLLNFTANNIITAGVTQTTPGEVLVLRSAGLVAPGQRDSHSLLWTGQGHDGSQHDVDWKAFVEAANNDGTSSLWKLATRIDAAGYADKLEIDSDGSFHIIQAGPHSFGGPLSGFTRFKITGSFISDGTGSQMEGFSVQGPIQGAPGDTIGLYGQEINTQITTQTATESIGDIAALNVLEPQISDNLTGNITRASTVRILSMPSEGVENFGLLLAGATQAIDVTNTEAFLVRKFADTGDVFTVDTTNEQIIMSAASSLQWSTDLKLFRDNPQQLALRDGLNDNFFYIYGTFTDSSNYERLAVYAGSSLFYVVEPQSAGTGNNTINMILRGLGGGTLTLGQADNGGVLFLRGPARFETGAFGAAALGPLTQQQLVATPSGQTATASMRIPAGSLVLAITARVVTTVTGPATFSIGDGVDVDRWGAGIAVASGTTSGVPDFTSTTIQYNLATAADVVITSDGVDFTGGEVRIIVYYMQFGSPLS